MARWIDVPGQRKADVDLQHAYVLQARYGGDAPVEKLNAPQDPACPSVGWTCGYEAPEQVSVSQKSIAAGGLL